MIHDINCSLGLQFWSNAGIKKDVLPPNASGAWNVFIMELLKYGSVIPYLYLLHCRVCKFEVSGGLKGSDVGGFLIVS